MSNEHSLQKAKRATKGRASLTHVLTILANQKHVSVSDAIYKFVGTYKPTSMSFLPTKYLMYQQNNERNSSFRM